MPYNHPPTPAPNAPPESPGGGCLAAEGAVWILSHAADRTCEAGRGASSGQLVDSIPNPEEGDSGLGSAPEEQGKRFLLQDQAGRAGRGTGVARGSPGLIPTAPPLGSPAWVSGVSLGCYLNSDVTPKAAGPSRLA